MDYVPLVNEQLDAGKRLLERLVEERIKVMAACWIKGTDSSVWKLHITSNLVKKGGVVGPAYGRVDAALQTMPQPFWIELSDIKLHSPSDHFSTAVLKVMRSSKGKLPRGLGSGSLGFEVIDAAYIYGPITAPVRQT